MNSINMGRCLSLDVYALLAGDSPLPLNILRDLLGHTETKTTEIYRQCVGKEKRKLVMQVWES